MGYYLYAFIGKSQTLKANALQFQSARIVLLKQDVAMIPLTHELHQEIDVGHAIEGFSELSSEIEEWAQQLSAAGIVAYIEAEFFGGDGGQSAVAWNAGHRVLDPMFEQHSINEVLKLIGVRKNDAHDEFDAIGLGKHRDTNQWT